MSEIFLTNFFHRKFSFLRIVWNVWKKIVIKIECDIFFLLWFWWNCLCICFRWFCENMKEKKCMEKKCREKNMEKKFYFFFRGLRPLKPHDLWGALHPTPPLAPDILEWNLGMKILLNEKTKKYRKIAFAYVSEHCAAFGTKNSIWPVLRGDGSACR